MYNLKIKSAEDGKEEKGRKIIFLKCSAIHFSQTGVVWFLFVLCELHRSDDLPSLLCWPIPGWLYVDTVCLHRRGRWPKQTYTRRQGAEFVLEVWCLGSGLDCILYS